jgi:hypothetical protein
LGFIADHGVNPDPADLERIETFLHAMMEMEKANAMH